MSLQSALVDRGRVIRSEPSSTERIGGSSRMVPVEGPWFFCMLQLATQPGSQDGTNGRTRAVASPTLLADVLDENGDAVDLRVGDQVEVVSDRFGRQFWEATGDAEPLAKLYEVIGYQVTVRRVADHAFTPVGA